MDGWGKHMVCIRLKLYVILLLYTQDERLHFHCLDKLLIAVQGKEKSNSEYESKN